MAQRQGPWGSTVGGALLGLIASFLGSTLSHSQDFAPKRNYEPVVIEGKALAEWVGTTDATRITLHVYRNNSWVPIPFQYDKRRKIHVNFNVDPTDAGYQGENCEYGYYQELHDGPAGQGARADFASNTLQGSDEFVFLLKDVLSQTSQAPTSAWVDDLLSDTDRYEISLYDPKTNAYRYVYAFRWPSAPPPSNQIDSTDYIQWATDHSIPMCPLTELACSDVKTLPNSLLADVATNDVHFSGNWITDALRVRNFGSDTLPLDDLLDRFQYSAPPDEDETGWSNSGSPEFLGYTDGHIRVVRAVQGAQSGRRTTKYEFIYPTMFVTRVNLRVHNLNSLHAALNHEQSVALEGRPSGNEGWMWSATSLAAANKPFDWLDGFCNNATCVPTSITFADWVQANTALRAGYSHVFVERRALPAPQAGRTMSYADAVAVGGHPAGRFERNWPPMGCTEDGVITVPTGCSDPEADDLLFARMETIIVPQKPETPRDAPGSVIANTIAENLLQKPVQAVAYRQSRNSTPPNPGSPCTPTLSSEDPHTGAAKLNLGPAAPCGGTIGQLVFRSSESGPFNFVKDVGLASTWTDYTTVAGQTYSYKIVGYNRNNVESGYSSTVTITPTDTTAPPIPLAPQASATSTTVTLTEQSLPCTRDFAGLNVYVSQVPGGPYAKLNPSPISVGVQPVVWTQAGFQPSHNYYFVVTSVDFSGNESAHSSEVAVHTGS